MKYLINSSDFTKFDYKFNKFVEKYKNDKNINKVNIYYRKFCFIFKNKNVCTILQIESFWAILKRGIISQFHWVSKKWLQSYLMNFVLNIIIVKKNSHLKIS